MPLINNGQNGMPEQEQEGEQTSDQSYNEKIQEQNESDIPVAESSETVTHSATAQQEREEL